MSLVFGYDIEIPKVKVNIRKDLKGHMVPSATGLWCLRSLLIPKNTGPPSPMKQQPEAAGSTSWRNF